uniref:Uncharacterized protein n=1 Tax=Sphaerodactylus townsendi TaxID=933632 RepID=A0ACB8EMW4_9SAUR
MGRFTLLHTTARFHLHAGPSFDGVVTDRCKIADAVIAVACGNPPQFTAQPEEEHIVFPNDDIILKCEATGNPPLTFRWTKDAKEFDPQKEAGVTRLNGSGTLLITTSNGIGASRFQGIYRCYAGNALGTAMSLESRVVVETAPQWPKESMAPFEVEEGASAILPCNPPESAFTPKIYWLNSKIIHIKQNERVNMGQDGNLYFANVQLSDSRTDYICNAHFLGPRVIIQKEPIELKVKPTNSILMRKPRLMVPDKSSYVALQGKTLTLECIPEGLPTPIVEWIYKDRLMPLHRADFENFNRTLRIENVSEDDDGEYQCLVRNTEGETQHTYHVTVEGSKTPVCKLVTRGSEGLSEAGVDYQDSMNAWRGGGGGHRQREQKATSAEPAVKMSSMAVIKQQRVGGEDVIPEEQKLWAERMRSEPVTLGQAITVNGVIETGADLCSIKVDLLKNIPHKHCGQVNDQSHEVAGDHPSRFSRDTHAYVEVLKAILSWAYAIVPGHGQWPQ